MALERFCMLLGFLYENREQVILEGKIEPIVEDGYECAKNFKGVRIELRNGETLNIKDLTTRRCPKSDCGNCVSSFSGSAEERVIAMIGGPGSGKTATMVALLDFLKNGRTVSGGSYVRVLRCDNLGLEVSYDESDCNGMGDFIQTYYNAYQEGKVAAKTEENESGRNYTLRIVGRAVRAGRENPTTDVSNNQKKVSLIKLVDVAGEKFKDALTQAQVERADLYWFCISPGQLSPTRYSKQEAERISADLKNKDTDYHDSEYKVTDIMTVVQGFRATQVGVADPSPLALILTKADMYFDDPHVIPQVNDTTVGSPFSPLELLNCLASPTSENVFGLANAHGHIGFMAGPYTNYQRKVKGFFSQKEVGNSILSALAGDDGKKPHYAIFACSAYGSDAGNMSPKNVELPLFWSMVVFGLLPAVCHKTVEEQVSRPGARLSKLFGKKKAAADDNRTYQNAVFTPIKLIDASERSDAEKKKLRQDFERLVYWGDN